jgi:FtsP/CotA-like multicopper oxidase with cupredoxin domain
LTQQPVRDKSSFEYKISFPDAGVFWYHPHVREDYQQELGLYGAYVVAPAPGEKWETVQNEEVVFLDDVLVQGETLAPFYEDAATHALMGRFGNVMLVNGEVGPRFAAEQGEIKRFYIVNSANARTFRIAIPGSQMKLVGGDNGRMASEEAVSELTLAPSERAIVDVRFQRTGRFEIRNITPQKTYTLATVMVTEQIALNDDESARFERFAVSPGKAEMEKLVAEYANKPADKRIRMTVAMGMMDGAHGGMMHEHGGGHMMAADASGIEWEDHMPSENAASHSGDVVWKIVDEATKKENMEISWSFRKGSVVKLAVINDASSMHPMQHPFHIHGQKFLVLDINGTPVENQGWKDTVLIPTGATANLLVRMDNPGDWMAHCHIAEHLTSGMMFAFTVR